jgi:hypothetical protein
MATPATAKRKTKLDLLIMTEEGDIYLIPARQLGQAKRTPKVALDNLRQLLRENCAGKAIGLTAAVYTRYGVQANGNGLPEPTEAAIKQSGG